mgnify:CR=1 FL=1
MERTGPFWDAVEGRVPMPAAAATLGWELRSIDPEQRPGVYYMRDGWRRQLEGPARHATSPTARARQTATAAATARPHTTRRSASTAPPYRGG